MSSFTLRRRLASAFVALSVALVLGVVVAVISTLRNYQAQERVTSDIFAIYAASGELDRALLDQETGFRGYALSREESSLEPYEQGLADTARLTKRLDRIERDLPRLEQARLAALRQVEEWRRGFVQPGLATVRGGGELTPAQLRAGARQFDEVRTSMATYQGEIRQARSSAVDDLRRNNIVLFGLIATGALLAVVSALLLWRALSRWVTQPLAQLGTEVVRVEQGDLSHAVTVQDAPLEIEVLAGQVESMRLRILQEYALAEQARLDAQEARQLIEEQAEDLSRSNAELEQFAYVASHDLQEPLRKVASFCQLIERRYKGQLDERGEQYIEFAVDGAKRMQRLINDLLAFSRVGRVTNEFSEVELETVFAQALRQLDLGLGGDEARVTHDPLPVVEGDASLLTQLFQNLVGNAVKFRSEDRAPRVHVGVRRVGDDWELSCADNGIGIDAQYADKIFAIFQRLHGRDAYGGTGIGLAMCKKIVEHHGGRLWLDTSVASGATFRWTLPVEVERNATHDRTAAGHPGDRSAAGGG